MSILSAPHFHNEEAAIEFLEGIIYANGVFCPKCGNVGESYKIKGSVRSTLLQGLPQAVHREGRHGFRE